MNSTNFNISYFYRYFQAENKEESHFTISVLAPSEKNSSYLFNKIRKWSLQSKTIFAQYRITLTGAISGSFTIGFNSLKTSDINFNEIDLTHYLNEIGLNSEHIETLCVDA